MSLLYLVDRQMLLDHGAMVTGDRARWSADGPILVQLLDRLTSNFESGPLSEELSRHEVRLLEQTDERFGWLPDAEFESAFRTAAQEWALATEGTTMSPEAILRAGSRTDEEVRHVAETAEDCWFFDSAGHTLKLTDA